jgi:Domain of unknown function (DUF4276)
MTRLYVIAEGLTEVDFVTRILKPHLETRTEYSTTVVAPTINGYRTYAALKKFVKTLLHSQSPDLRVSTMIDLFKLASDFPGRAAVGDMQPLERVRLFEQLFAEDIADQRFFPYLQLHEFEALVLVELRTLADQHPNRRRAIDELAERLEQDFDSPEHVNGLRPPSYWIKDAVPEYNKRVDGVATVERIGLARLRSRCHHFEHWVECLEGVV